MIHDLEQPISAGAPPALHMNTISHLIRDCISLQPQLDVVKSGYRDTYTEIGELRKAIENIKTEHSLSLVEKNKHILEKSDKVLDLTQKRFDSLSNYLNGKVTLYESQLPNPLKELNDTKSEADPEIRTHLKLLNDSERKAFINESLKENNIDVIRALLTQPYFLSGVTKTEHEYFLKEYTNQFQQSFDSEKSQWVELLKKAQSMTEKNRNSLPVFIEDAMGFSFERARQIESSRQEAHSRLGL